MILWLLSIYLGTILGAFVATVILIFFGQSWGQLPHLYLRLVRTIQNLFPDVYPENSAPWPSLISKSDRSVLVRHKENSSASFRFVLDAEDPWIISQDAIRSGVEAILQDDLSSAFDMAPTYSENLVRLKPRCTWNHAQIALFYLTVGFRLFFLFPIRLCLFVCSFGFVALAVMASFLKEFNEKEKTSIAIIYCRLFCSSMGLVAQYNEEIHRPKRPGIAISNHLSPNDIQMLFADVRHGADYGFVVTGQKHSGIIWAIQRLVERMCPSMWLERKNNNERKSFTDSVLQIAKTGGPILLFPEGFCSNNTQILQFRKALFEEGVDIHPMAIKQDARYGDNFWSEDLFYMYILRCLVSWAVVYDVTYIPPMRRMPSESAPQFAKRCQLMISQVADIPAGNFDGSLWYKKTEQERLRNLQQVTCADALKSHYLLEKEKEESSSESDSDFIKIRKPDTLEFANTNGGGCLPRNTSIQLTLDPGMDAAEQLVEAVLEYLPFIIPSESHTTTTPIDTPDQREQQLLNGETINQNDGLFVIPEKQEQVVH